MHFHDTNCELQEHRAQLLTLHSAAVTPSVPAFGVERLTFRVEGLRRVVLIENF